MPAPIPDLSRNQDCHHYQAPTGQRCGSPALKGEYYCYHHHIKHAARSSRVLIDPEVTRMELPPIEDRASIFVALAAIVHRLAENTIDTRRASIMVHALHGNLRALQNPPAPKTPPAPTPPTPDSHSEAPPETPRAPESAAAPESESGTHSDARSAPKPLQTLAASGQPQPTQPPTARPDQPAPTQISISKESLLYFLRCRHCAHCNAELFPESQLTERRHPGAWPTIIEESQPPIPIADWIPEEIAKQMKHLPLDRGPALASDRLDSPYACVVHQLRAAAEGPKSYRQTVRPPSMLLCVRPRPVSPSCFAFPTPTSTPRCFSPPSSSA